MGVLRVKEVKNLLGGKNFKKGVFYIIFFPFLLILLSDEKGKLYGYYMR